MAKRLRLRDKMTLWYTLMTLVTLAAFSCAIYFTTNHVLTEMLERDVRLSLQQIIAQVENEDGLLTFEDEVPISSGSMYFVTEKNGSELASFGNDITLFDNFPVNPDAYRIVQGESERWMLLDSDVIDVDDFEIRVRVAGSFAMNDRVLASLSLLLFISVPFVVLVALLGGWLIAKKSLAPIGQIIGSANEIAQGDLSVRIPPAPVKDEIGELSDTLNHMLDSVETAFAREKRFTSDASHELRTPVAVMRAYAESLRAEDNTTEEQRTEIDTMLTECERMQKIIAQLLTITRGQEGHYPICMEPVALRDVAEGVADSLQDKLNAQQSELRIDVPENLVVQADQSLVTELLLNLTENAIKYGKLNGHIFLSASQEQGQTRITVSDDGIGIPQEALPHIFERFYRVDTVRDRSGTGLGLSIAEWIVKAHNGKMEVQSELGKGTAFQVTLPEKN
ncbi:MAG: HAMP domain-containing sensor histidine kinase [Eubacteriales bacterium]|nr:HAMP domain-containing sensor histidine kinase [Eubacteriales bacterium]